MSSLATLASSMETSATVTLDHTNLQHRHCIVVVGKEDLGDILLRERAALPDPDHHGKLHQRGDGR